MRTADGRRSVRLVGRGGGSRRGRRLTADPEILAIRLDGLRTDTGHLRQVVDRLEGPVLAAVLDDRSRFGITHALDRLGEIGGAGRVDVDRSRRREARRSDEHDGAQSRTD